MELGYVFLYTHKHTQTQVVTVYVHEPPRHHATRADNRQFCQKKTTTPKQTTPQSPPRGKLTFAADQRQCFQFGDDDRGILLFY